MNTYWTLDQNDVVLRHLSNSLQHLSLRFIVFVFISVKKMNHLLLLDS